MLVGTICRICRKTRRDLINRYVTNDVAVGNVSVEFLGLPTTFSYGKAYLEVQAPTPTPTRTSFYQQPMTEIVLFRDIQKTKT